MSTVMVEMIWMKMMTMMMMTMTSVGFRSWMRSRSVDRSDTCHSVIHLRTILNYMMMMMMTTMLGMTTMMVMMMMMMMMTWVPSVRRLLRPDFCRPQLEVASVPCQQTLLARGDDDDDADNYCDDDDDEDYYDGEDCDKGGDESQLKITSATCQQA